MYFPSMLLFALKKGKKGQQSHTHVHHNNKGLFTQGYGAYCFSLIPASQHLGESSLSLDEAIHVLKWLFIFIMFIVHPYGVGWRERVGVWVVVLYFQKVNPHADDTRKRQNQSMAAAWPERS
jgi:hypothetical protein